MYAVLRINTFDAAKLGASTAQLEEFDRIHASQPGYEGNITVDLGGGRRMMVNLWNSEEDGKAAFAHLRPEVDRLLTPLMSAASEFLGAGPVVAADLPSTTEA
ncbi:hypothetical protein OG394_15165 [Kribbella sp. NBC_01245]|uniref:hypothetical protein n=1 Tax=Kribbella sp. NBC_01245 TaxID=2903578 RepID=UPI002E2C246B|nr:hypothetical protein [Kribbella sp. NBC_01245]